MITADDNATGKTRDSWLRQRLVIVADDDPDSREIIRSAIESPEIGVLEAGSAERALEVSSNFVIDLAIVDVFMPGKGGIWMIERLRERNPALKIISVSGGYPGMPPGDAIRAAEKIGADVTLEKPFDIRSLQNLVSDLVS